jgi:uncharacterized protein YegL
MEYQIEQLDSDDYCTISADDEYFVQFCNPPLPTFVADNATIGEYNYDVVLMIDSSGSMYGEKLSHAVDAIKNVINALPDTDNFNIIRFGNKVRTWRQYMAKSDDKVKAKAFEFLDEITAGGSTNIENALLEAISLASESASDRIPIILFLTDGGPSVDGRDIQSVVQTISESASSSISINGISLGTNDLAGWQLVQRLTQKNRGLSSKLFDISTFPTEIPKKFLEMKNHARSIRGLSNIKFSFDGDVVSDLTNTHFDEYSEGSDLVILGRLKGEEVSYLKIDLEYTDVEGTVWSEQKNIAVRYINKTEERDAKFGANQDDYNPIKQQWAVTAVHQLLKKRAVATTETEYNILTAEAKKLSYEHHIVSPVVSFLIRKPKSSLNLINNRLEAPGTERERRSDGKTQETHEIRYQYRKLWWRPSKRDNLEETKMEIDSLLETSQNKHLDESELTWLGFGSSPLMVSYRPSFFN